MSDFIGYLPARPTSLCPADKISGQPLTTPSKVFKKKQFQQKLLQTKKKKAKQKSHTQKRERERERERERDKSIKTIIHCVLYKQTKKNLAGKWQSLPRVTLPILLPQRSASHILAHDDFYATVAKQLLTVGAVGDVLGDDNSFFLFFSRFIQHQRYTT